MLRITKKIILFTFVLILLAGCGKEADAFEEVLPTELPPELYVDGSLDIVVLFDTSGSMDDEAKALCNNIEEVIGDIREKEISVRYQVWGIVAKEFSIYNEETEESSTDPFCLVSMIPEQIEGFKVGHEEDWGQAIIDVAENYEWKEETTRIIIPISDECPVEGSEPLEELVGGKIISTCNEADEAIIPSVWQTAKENEVRIFPISGAQFEEADRVFEIAPVIELMETVAENTGGKVFRSQDAEADIADGLSSLIQFAIVDKDGDGVLEEEEIGKKSSGWKWVFAILILVGGAVFAYLKVPEVNALIDGLVGKTRTRKTSGSFGVMLPDGTAFPLKEGDRFGAGESCQVRLDGEGVDEVHAELLYSRDKWMLYDNGSQGGIWLDGERRHILEVKPGMLVRLGEVDVRFFAIQGETTETAPAASAPKVEIPSISEIWAPAQKWIVGNWKSILPVAVVLLVIVLLFKACSGKEKADEVVYSEPPALEVIEDELAEGTQEEETEELQEDAEAEEAEELVADSGSRPEVTSMWVSNADGVELAFVAAGEFVMGENGDPSTSPEHEVYLDAFWIDKYEVTNLQYAACVESGVCMMPMDTTGFTKANDYYPVVNITWQDAKTYCEWVGRRLPTEAEWEKAARGLGELSYPWGNEKPNADMLNYNKHVGNAARIGQYPDDVSPNAAMDMAGNVSEWIYDYYDSQYYGSQTSWDNPIGPDGGKNRVLRGGSWKSEAAYVLVYHRAGLNPRTWSDDIGFRCATSEMPDMAGMEEAPTAIPEPVAMNYGDIDVGVFGNFSSTELTSLRMHFETTGSLDVTLHLLNDVGELRLALVSDAVTVVIMDESAREAFKRDEQIYFGDNVQELSGGCYGGIVYGREEKPEMIFLEELAAEQCFK